MIKNEYQELFKTRKWKLALSFLPLDTPTPVKLKKASDLLILRACASEFTRESEDKRVSVNIDFDNKQAIVPVTKKNQEP